MVERLIYFGWPSICAALDLSKRSKESAKRILKPAKLLRYENGTPYVVKLELEIYLTQKK